MRRKTRRITRVASVSETELADFKAFLGPLVADYTDGELRQLRREMYAMADVLLELWLAKQGRKPEPTIEF